jgi:hypothetical protein
MKVKSVLCPAALIGAVVIAQLYASAAIPDAVTADGKHYTIEFENQYVRVLRIHYGFPHERGNMHNHPRSVTVFLTDGKLKMTMVDGKSIAGTVKKGQTVWEEAGPHQPENLTGERFEAVRIELKSQPVGGKTNQ